MHSAQRLEWFLILGCVALAVLLGLACVFDDDGDFGVIACLADGASLSPEEVSSTLPTGDTSLLGAEPHAQLDLDAPSLLAAAPGGLCLLD